MRLRSFLPLHYKPLLGRYWTFWLPNHFLNVWSKDICSPVTKEFNSFFHIVGVKGILKIFSYLPSLANLIISCSYALKFDTLFFSWVFLVFQKSISAIFQLLMLFDFSSSNFVHRLIEMFDQVKTIVYNLCIGQNNGYRFQAGFKTPNEFFYQYTNQNSNLALASWIYAKIQFHYFAVEPK